MASWDLVVKHCCWWSMSVGNLCACVSGHVQSGSRFQHRNSGRPFYPAHPPQAHLPLPFSLGVSMAAASYFLTKSELCHTPYPTRFPTATPRLFRDPFYVTSCFFVLSSASAKVHPGTLTNATAEAFVAAAKHHHIPVASQAE